MQVILPNLEDLGTNLDTIADFDDAIQALAYDIDIRKEQRAIEKLGTESTNEDPKSA